MVVVAFILGLVAAPVFHVDGGALEALLVQVVDLVWAPTPTPTYPASFAGYNISAVSPTSDSRAAAIIACACITAVVTAVVGMVAMSSTSTSASASDASDIGTSVGTSTSTSASDASAVGISDFPSTSPSPSASTSSSASDASDIGISVSAGSSIDSGIGRSIDNDAIVDITLAYFDSCFDGCDDIISGVGKSNSGDASDARSTSTSTCASDASDIASSTSTNSDDDTASSTSINGVSRSTNADKIIDSIDNVIGRSIGSDDFVDFVIGCIDCCFDGFHDIVNGVGERSTGGTGGIRSTNGTSSTSTSSDKPKPRAHKVGRRAIPIARRMPATKYPADARDGAWAPGMTIMLANSA
ncbi:hypothetical protein LPJ61_001518 [Coemansia biformis]|uniref:Uncharacterized protein n=1 Tax=Coemansia biformis TaxID=1286918 RepID=A0A9W7Y9W4_9FUNG|nr:hypothetical protein LPJ61_001518 [Coemansia biformis]